MFRRVKERLKPALADVGAFFRTDFGYIARQGSWLFSGNVAASLLSFLLVLAFGNLLTKEAYGTYRYILSIASMFLLFSLSEMTNAVTKSVAQGYENAYKPAVRAKIQWGFLGGVISLVVAGYYFIQGNSQFGWAFVVAACAVPFFDATNVYLAIFAGKKRFDLQTRWNTITRVASAGILIGTLLVTNNIAILLMAYYVPYLVIGFAFGSRQLQQLQLNQSNDPTMVSYGKHLSALALIAFGVNYLDSIIVFQFLGPVELAIFSIAQAPANRVQSFFAVIPEIALPKLAQNNLAVVKANLFSKVGRAMLITAPIVVAYIFAVPTFFKLFLPNYIDAIIYAQLLGLPLMWYPAVLFNRIMTAKGATALLLRYNIIESVVQLASMLYAVSNFGIMGAVVARVFISLFGYSLMASYVRKM